jgi:hypothetical protein
VYKNNRGASNQLQNNAQICISNVTAETLHQTAFTRVEEIECLIAESDGHVQHSQ